MSVQPQYAVPEQNLLPLCDYPSSMMTIPPSKMFLIKGALATYKKTHGDDAKIYDASQGDGGASLDGVPAEILRAATELQIKHGTGYDQPYGYDGFRNAVANAYWKIDTAATGWGAKNVVAGIGGRDILMKAFDAMIHCGRGYIGDCILTSAVPWISYNWGPYAAGLNVLHAPGDESDGWAFTEEGLAEAVQFAAKQGRKIAGMILTSPDNPTGRTISLERQIALAQKALDLGIEFVLFDWIYHWITEGQPHDINQVLKAFEPAQRDRLMFLDGLTKSLGASNIRSAHLIASDKVVKFIVSRASHAVFPNFYSQAVAVVAYEMGFEKAAASTIEPTNASRRALRRLLDETGYRYIMGDGYYAFINIADYTTPERGSEAIGPILAENFGVAVVPGESFSDAGRDWVRFSYATPVAYTEAAFKRFDEGIRSLR